MTIVAASIPVLRALVHEGTTQRHIRSLDKISDPRLSIAAVAADHAGSPSPSAKELTPSSLEAGRSGADSDDDRERVLTAADRRSDRWGQ